VARGSDIVAVLQIDMIGFDVLPGRTFELHAGFMPSAAVQKLSIRLAELVAAQVSRVASVLPPAQLLIYDWRSAGRGVASLTQWVGSGLR
jgi:hypothetical protein